MQDQYSRTQLLLGKEAMEKLHNSRVAVFGIGGVGGYTVEALARSGVGALDLIDDDKVCLTNLNRQIVATRKTVGQYKVDVAEQRIHEIDPNIKVTTYKIFFTPETQDQFDFTQYDYVVDAIDTVTGKIALVVKAKEAGTPIICAMGAGNKMDPTRFEVTDIYKTSVCPLAKVMRTECRKRRIKHLKVVYSKEPAMTPIEDDSISCKDHCICPPGTQRKCTIRRSVPGSNAFVPSVAGLIIGGEVVKDLIGFVPMKGLYFWKKPQCISTLGLFCRRDGWRRPMLFESTRLREFAVCAKEKRLCISTQAFSWWARVDCASRASKIAPQGLFCRRDV